MEPGTSQNLVLWPTVFARLAAILVTLAGVSVIVGWTFGIAALQSIAPGWTKMPPATATGLVIGGFALAILTYRELRPSLDQTKQTSRYRRLREALALIVVSMGAVRVTEYLLGKDLGIDHLWFQESLTGGSADARMSPTTAFNFVLLGSALLLAKRIAFFRIFQLLILLAGLVGWLGFSHYLYGGVPLLPYADMAIHTAIAFLILSTGLLCTRTDGGLMGLLISDTAGGVMARALVPAVLVFPMMLGWLSLQGQRAGLFGTEAGISIFALSNIVVFGALIWRNAVLLHRSDVNRNKAEASLGESQIRLESALESGEIGTWTYDVATNESWIDESLTRILGRTLEDLRGGRPEVFFSFVHPEDASRAERAFQNSIHLSGNYSTEFRYIRPDGAVIWLAVKGRLERDQSGNPRRMMGACVDITERKFAEAKLQTQLSRLELLNRITRAIGERQDLRSIYQIVIRRLEDDLPIDFCCICHYDAASNALTVTNVGIKSERLARDLGISEQATIVIDPNGLSLCMQGQLLYEPDMAEVAMSFPQLLTKGGLRSLVAAPLLVESQVFGALITARREPNSFSSSDCEFLRQLSEQVALAAHQAQLYAALQRAYNDLKFTQEAVMEQERLRALGQMASGIAHDINNALSPVMLYTEGLLETESNLSDNARKRLETIQRAIEDVAQTIGRLREFYRPHESEITLTEVNLNMLTEQVVDLTRARWHDMPQQQGHVIKVVTELAPDLPKIMGAEHEIRDALTNLVFNAVDAMPDGGTLTIRTSASQADQLESLQKVTLEIRDTGTGMDDETRTRCLEPFFTTKGERGSGLGLAMVYGMVERHSADLAIESEPGQGTKICVSFSLPVRVPAVDGTSSKPAVSLPLRILVIDDDPILIKSLSDTLENEGHAVVTAYGGQAGIDAFQVAVDSDQSFDVVITDLGMPHVDGRKVAASVKKISPATPVILFTGWGQRLLAEGDIPLHVDRVLNKPPKLRDLREALFQTLLLRQPTP